MDVRLVAVEKRNWIDCVRLSLSEEQAEFVASNVDTIAESKFEPHYELRAIQRGETIVGMLAYCPEVDEPEEGLFWLFRLMIDQGFQRNGYGKRAVQLCITEMKGRGATRIRTMCKPANSVAFRCYQSLGFEPKGFLDDGDQLLELMV